jgi:hypothetical protein
VNDSLFTPMTLPYHFDTSRRTIIPSASLI